jgi:hypothetical protein
MRPARRWRYSSPASRHRHLIFRIVDLTRTDGASRGDRVAFSHFLRFDMYYGEEVLYSYEIQIEEQWQWKGMNR